MNFPLLKTGAVTQYPLEQCARYSTQSVWFLDGSRQTFRVYGAPVRCWIVNLDLLDEQELSALIDFVDAQGANPFTFTDPVSGAIVAKCIVGQDSFDAVMTAEVRGKASLVIEEVP